MGKIKGLWRRAGNDAQNGVSLAAIRVWNGGHPDGDMSPMIFPDFEGNPGRPMDLQNGPFLANRGCGLPKFRVKLRVAGGRAEMIPKMGTLSRD